MINQLVIDNDFKIFSDQQTLQISEAEQRISSNHDIFRPIHYLGSKLRLVKHIKNIIDNLDPSNNFACDIFSGSGTVAKYLSYSRPVISADIQEYSRVLCSALLKPTVKSELYYHFVEHNINPNHYEKLCWALEPLIEYETSCIDQAMSGNPLPLCELMEGGSILGYELGYNNTNASLINKYIIKTLKRFEKIKFGQQPATLITRYFGGTYFSYKQAMQIDVLLEAISNSPQEIRDILLAALLSATSDAVNTVGKQFAQPLKPRKSNGAPKDNIGEMVSRDRYLDIYKLYNKWLNRYLETPKTDYAHEVIRMDYRDVLDSLNKKVKVVYADPPYTRDHYSRYYHVLETICMRDTPNISKTTINGKVGVSRGMYRKDRHQSPFCIKSQVTLAFEALVENTQIHGASLVLSYSPYGKIGGSRPRLMTIDELMLIARKYYSNVELIPVANFSHSKLNCADKNYEASQNAESFIVCNIKG